MRQTKWVTVGIILATLVGGALTLFVPIRQLGDYPLLGFRISFIISAMVTVSYIGAAGLFLWGLTDFKRELRIVYGFICAGILGFGAAHLQAPMVTYFELVGSWWVRSGLVVLPYTVPIILLFIGTKRFAKLLEIKTKWASAWFVMGVALLCIAVSIGLGALAGMSAQLFANIALATWSWVFLASIAMIARVIYRTVNVQYHMALRWFAAANTAAAFSGVLYVFGLITLGERSVLSDYGITNIPDVIGGLMLVGSGYAFTMITQATTPAAKSNVSLVDIIVYAAGLASNTSRIDPFLDRLRLITAASQRASLSGREQETLRQVYGDIERYLINEEELRQFTSASLRHAIATNFGLKDEALAALLDSSDQS